MRKTIKDGLSGIALITGCLAMTLGYFACIHHFKVPDRNGTPTVGQYFVPEPLALERGELYMIKLPMENVRGRSGVLIMYELNGKQYTSTLFVEVEAKSKAR